MTETLIPGFKIIEKLGDGGMSSVWKATQVSLDRVVAIKVLSSKMATDPGDIKQFQFEAQAAARLKHPGIVQVYDASIANGLYYIVMEYVAGYTVGDWIRRKPALDEVDVLLVCECVADALKYAWEQAGIIHCDIKPDNVIIDADGTVKVADLGLARTINAVGGTAQVEVVMGTPNYISPEQSSGEAELDCRADIYSLGAMMYHLATGRLMFEGHSASEIMDMQITDRVDDPADLREDLSPGLCWLIEKMLVKDPERRVPTWDEVLRDIDLVKRGRMPAGELPEEGESTVTRSESREHAPVDEGRIHVPQGVGGRARRTRDRSSHDSHPLLWALVGLFGVAVIAFIIHVVGAGDRAPAYVAPAPGASQADNQRLRAERRLREAQEWAATHPQAFDDAIGRFEGVRRQAMGTPYALKAANEIARLRKARSAAVDAVMRDLDQQARDAVDRRQSRRALAVYTDYRGPFASDTVQARADRLRSLREELRRASFVRSPDDQPGAAAFDPAAALAEGLSKVASALAEGDYAASRSHLNTILDDERLAGQTEPLGTLPGLIDDVAGIDQRILDSFARQLGEEISVYTTRGEKRIIVQAVEGTVIEAEELLKTQSGRATVELTIPLSELDVRERLRRMGPDDWPEVKLTKGFMALDAGSVDYARRAFESVSGPLVPHLLALTEADSGVARGDESTARKALGLVMLALNVPVGEFDVTEWANAVARHRFSPTDAEMARELVTDFRARHGGTPFCASVEPVLKTLEQAQ